MSFVRPEVAAALVRWREVALALAAAAFGLWLATRGGYFYAVLGAVVVALALGLAVTAWRRLRFGTGGAAPGVVRVDEGAIAYFGPQAGGIVALSELAQVDSLISGGLPCWRLIQSDGQAVTIPKAAAGAERLFDVFAALPGAAPQTFLDAPAADLPRRIWRHPQARAEPALRKP